MERLPERPRLDLVSIELTQELTAIHTKLVIDQGGIEPASAFGPGSFWHWGYTGNAAEILSVSRRNAALCGNKGPNVFGLSAADCCLNVGESVIKADLTVNIFERIVLRLRGEITRTHCNGFIVGDDHSAAAGCYELVAIETETRHVGKSAGIAPFVFRPEALRGIFNDWQVVFARDLDDRIDVGWVPEDVNGEDGPN